MPSRRTIQLLSIDVSLVVLVVVSLNVAVDAHATSAFPGLPPAEWSNPLFDGGLLCAFIALGGLALRLLARLARASRRWRREADRAAYARATAGTVMVEFALVLPIVLLVMGMIVQLALLSNASLVVRYATFMSARTAIVTFERAQPWTLQEWLADDLNKDGHVSPGEGVEVKSTAAIILAGLSPRSQPSGDPSAAAMERILRGRGGAWVGRDYAARMQYAEAATTVTAVDSYAPIYVDLYQLVINYLSSKDPTELDIISTLLGWLPAVNFGFNTLNYAAPKEVTVTVTYDFLVTIPGISLIPGLTRRVTLAGESRQVITLEHTVKLQSTGARQGHPIMFLGGSLKPGGPGGS